jgi:hypothetical protein
LYVQNRSGVVTEATQSEQAGIKTLTGATGQDNSQQRVLMQNRDFLVAFARELIGVQACRGSKAISNRSIA